LSYEQLVVHADLTGAFIISALQIVIFALLYQQLVRVGSSKFSSVHAVKESMVFDTYQINYLAAAAAISLAIICFFGILTELQEGIALIQANSAASNLISELLLKSFLLAISVGVLAVLFFMM